MAIIESLVYSKAAFIDMRKISYREEILLYSPGVVGRGKDVVYLASSGRPTDIGLQLGKAYYPCSRHG